MPFNLDEVASLLCCPDDGGPMAACAKGVRCEHCYRFYPLLSTNILDLLPSRPITFPGRSEAVLYREGYLTEFSRPSKIRADAKAWGAPEARSQKWLRLRERQAREVFQFLRVEPCEANLVFCDLSAGAGYCTFRAAEGYRVVFHCDLSMDALAYASAKARASHVENIIFVHADYFQPPFRNSVDHLTCLDTLIRGPWHETRLLRSIQGVLSSSGTAVVDFHNWWHNPIRRLGLLRNNFGPNRSYSKSETARLLASARIAQPQCFPFHQEIDPSSPLRSTVERMLPSTRWMYRFGCDPVGCN